MAIQRRRRIKILTEFYSLFLPLLPILPLIALAQTPSPSLEKIGISIRIEQPSSMKQEEEEKLVRLTPLKISSLQNRVYKIAISFDSQYLCLSTKEGKLLIYDLKNTKLILNKELSRATISALSSHPSENKVAFGDRDGFIGILNLDDKELERTIYELEEPISDIEYSSDGKVIGVAHFGGVVTFYNSQTKQLLLRTKPHEKSIYSLSIDRYTPLFATASRDQTVKISSLKKKKTLLTLRDHKSFVLTCAFSPNDNFLASGGGDGQVIIYKREGRTFARTPYFIWTCGDWVTSLKFFRHYLLAASKDGKLRIFDYRNKSLLKVIDTESPIVDIDINRNYLAVASPQGFKVYETKKILKSSE